MKKLLILLFSLFFLSSTSVFAEIPRNSINKIKQLNWSEIIDAVSETYQYATMVSDLVNQDGSNFYYPADEKYGKLSNNGIGKYKYKEPKFDGFIEFISDAISWSIDNQNNKICYGETDDLIDEYTCVYLFEGFENNKKYLYYSETKNGNFYARINQIIQIDNEQLFNQWSLISDRFSQENIIDVQAYDLESKRISVNYLDFSLSDFCYLNPRVQKREGVYYYPNEEIGISETSICIFKNTYGQYHSKGALVNGTFDGNWNWWHRNGQKLKKENFKNEFQEGTSISWYENGQTRSILNFQNGYIDGIQSWWYENGQFHSEYIYKNGKKEGKVTLWYPNGLKKGELNYQNNELVLKTKYIYDDGILIAERNYQNGKCISGDCD